MNKFKLAALPLAVAGIFASTSAHAGTEACFEVYKGGIDQVAAAFSTPYNLASCGARGVADAVTLADNDVTSIAYELTGVDADGDKVFGLDFDDIDNADADQVLVYIPTTDIPAGTLIEMKLSGSDAEFAGNGNQIHLVKYDEVAADGSFLAVASSDGVLDGTDTVTFITKAGTTIGAGTRLVFSQVSTGANDAAFVHPGILLGNTQCTDATRASSVQLEVTRATTDGGTGYDIIGALTSKETIAEISPQFYALHGGTTAEALVNAESEDSSNNVVLARTEFVYDPAVTEQLVAKKSEVVYKTAFYDRVALLDQAIAIDADDHLETMFVASSAPGAEVEMGLWNARIAATGVLDTQEEVETATTWGAFGLTEMTATEYDTEALDVFTPAIGGGDAETNPFNGSLTYNPLDGAAYNEMFYVVTNDQNTSPTTEIMNFNYVVDTHYTLDFGTDNELDHCAQEKKTHEIGVNGAVLKVPYVTSATGNFVRITNEHDEAAEVTFDLFGESADGTAADRKVTAIALGSIPAQSSVVYMVPKIIEEANAAGYLGADGGYAEGDLGANFKSSTTRHTVTFTVTAPRDSVHGVAVQKVIGAVADRVMPVLDQNAWSQ